MLKALFALAVVTASSAQAFEVKLTDYACDPTITLSETPSVLYVKTRASDQAIVVTTEITNAEKSNATLISATPERGFYNSGDFKYEVTDTFQVDNQREFRIFYKNTSDELHNDSFYRALVKPFNENAWRIQNVDPRNDQKSVDEKHDQLRIVFTQSGKTFQIKEVNCGTTASIRDFSI